MKLDSEADGKAYIRNLQLSSNRFLPTPTQILFHDTNLFELKKYLGIKNLLFILGFMNEYYFLIIS